jgi:hypothetical protein
MFKYNITNVSYVGIGLVSPLYPLDVAGDVRWSGTLQGGTVPWARLSGYNLNVAWTGLLGWGNLTAYNLNVNWAGKLGWGNLTAYPNVITSIGSGLNANTQSLASDIVLGVNFTETQKRVVNSCSGSKAIQVINQDGSVSCVDINLYGNVTGTGTANYVAKWTGASTLGTSIIQDTGNVSIDAGTLFVDASNDRVGIGTTSPGQKLTVSGNILTTGDIYIDNADVRTWLQNFYDTFQITIGSAKLTLDRVSGNAGIGTSSPQAKVNVSGTFNATSNNGVLFLDSDGNIKVGI